MAVVGRVESKAAAAVAAAAGIETTKTVAVALAAVLLDILRPHPGTGNTDIELRATDCAAQRVVAEVIDEFGFVAIQGGAKVDLQLRAWLP